MNTKYSLHERSFNFHARNTCYTLGFSSRDIHTLESNYVGSCSTLSGVEHLHLQLSRPYQPCVDRRQTEMQPVTSIGCEVAL